MDQEPTPKNGEIPSPQTEPSETKAKSGDQGHKSSGGDGAAAEPSAYGQPLSAVDIGARLFQWRDYTPIPLIVFLLVFAAPSVRSVTLGMLSVFLGELIRLYGVAFIGSVSRTRNVQTTGGELITSGPFALIRNPLYVGNFFLTLGLAIFGGVPWLIVLTVCAFCVQYHCIVRFEETLLVSKFDKTYQEYMEKVPAWIPSHIPSIDEIEWPDTFSPAIRSEFKTLGAIVAIIALLLFLHS